MNDLYEQDRRRAAAELAELQPVLAAARAAWRPYAQRIDAVNGDLEQNLLPTMWAANRDSMHARFGHRHATHRRAANATEAVADARTHIAAIDREGSVIKERLDSLTARAEDLSERAGGGGTLAVLDLGNDGRTDDRSRRPTSPSPSRRSPTLPLTPHTPAATAANSPRRTTRNSWESTACGTWSPRRITSIAPG